MSNQKRLEEYLVGEKGYLKENISNGKVIMLSGKWGSGKTHFWQNKIQTVLNEEEKKIPNHYISLYGKTSIQEIKNEIFLKVFESVDSFKSEEKTKKILKDSIDLVSSLTKSISVFGMSLDLSKITDTSFKKIDDLLNDEKLKRTENYLNSGAIICFDDFERKSKDIDLNDLFGFITQLTLNFSCKVVIILNDDVFEGEEKKIFSNVKEKSVSKFLKYEPSIEDLFKTIFESDERYRKLDDYKKIILSTIEETQELNARIYIQVLDNLVEWIENTNKNQAKYIKYLIYLNINFILNHYIFKLELIKYDINAAKRMRNLLDAAERGSPNNYIPEYKERLNIYIKEENLISNGLIEYLSNENYNNKEFIYKLKLKINNDSMEKKGVDKHKLLEYINNNQALVKSLYFINSLEISKLFDSHNKSEQETFQKISNFIETGILINE